MIRIIPSKHFLEQMQSRSIDDLSLCGYILLEISKNPQRSLFEITNGNYTFVVQYNKNQGVATLVTAWRGNRKRKEIETEFECNSVK